MFGRILSSLRPTFSARVLLHVKNVPENSTTKAGDWLYAIFVSTTYGVTLEVGAEHYETYMKKHYPHLVGDINPGLLAL